MNSQKAMTLAAMLTPERMATMPHGELLMLRTVLDQRSPLQDKLAPYEHRAFAREWAKENPARGWALPIVSAGYQGAKALGLVEGTKPSLSQLMQSIIGTREGYGS